MRGRSSEGESDGATRKEPEEKQEGQRATDGERAKLRGRRAVRRRKEPEEKQEGQRATGNKRVKREDQRVNRTAGEWLTAIRRCTGDGAGGEPESGRYRNDRRGTGIRTVQE